MDNPSRTPTRSDPVSAIAADPQPAAERLASLPTVAGVQVAGVIGDRFTSGAAGVTDIETGAPVTPHTRFRPGSITKLLTASLLQRCVADGLIDFEAPVDRYLPGPWPGVLVRHLISHSSGLDAADLLLDTGDDDQAIARYVEHLARGVEPLFPPGATFSYCNAGFVLAGRLAEVLLDRTWEQALRTHLLDPAGVDGIRLLPGRHAESDPYAARGHRAQGTTLTPLPRRLDHPMCTRGLAPAGGALTATATDLARFVRAHLHTPGTEIMRTLHAAAPGGVATMRGAGFGWMLWNNATQTTVRIGGANPGQSGIIAADPARDAAIVVLTNTDTGINAVTAALDATGPPAGTNEGPPPADLSCYVGRYVSHLGTLSLHQVDGGLTAHLDISDDPALRQLADQQGGGDPEPVLTPLDRVTFASPAGPVAFLDFTPDGAPRYLRWRMRVMRRTA